MQQKLTSKILPNPLSKWKATFYLEVLNLKANLKLKSCLKAVELVTLKKKAYINIRKQKLFLIFCFKSREKLLKGE